VERILYSKKNKPTNGLVVSPDAGHKMRDACNARLNEPVDRNPNLSPLSKLVAISLQPNFAWIWQLGRALTVPQARARQNSRSSQ